MKWPFDPRLLDAAQGFFFLFLVVYTIAAIITAWEIIVVSVFRDFGWL